MPDIMLAVIAEIPGVRLAAGQNHGLTPRQNPNDLTVKGGHSSKHGYGAKKDSGDASGGRQAGRFADQRPLPDGSAAVTTVESLLPRSRQGPMAVAPRYTKKLREAIQVLAG